MHATMVGNVSWEPTAWVGSQLLRLLGRFPTVGIDVTTSKTPAMYGSWKDLGTGCLGTAWPAAILWAPR